MREKGIVIDIEGLDCSFKETNSKALYVKFLSKGYKCVLLSFPNYESDSSDLVKRYLNGNFGDADHTGPYLTSLFYTIDRGITALREKINKLYNEGYIIILDRYTSSNFIFQGTKFNDEKKCDEYIKWLKDLEYNKMGLPEPDLTIFMDMPIEVSSKIIAKRKLKNGQDTDIHEQNTSFMKKVRENAIRIANNEDWKIVSCVNDKGQIRSRFEILNNIYDVVNPILKRRK